VRLASVTTVLLAVGLLMLLIIGELAFILALASLGSERRCVDAGISATSIYCDKRNGMVRHGWPF
jgi:hypothetical protein